MNKTKYLLVAAVAVFSLVLWSGNSLAQEWTEGNVQSYYQPRGWDTFEAGWFVGHRVYSPIGGDLGQIADLVIDRSDGHIALVLISDVPGFEDRYVAAPFGCLIRTGEDVFNLSFGDRDVSVTDFYADSYAYELERYASTVGLNSIPSTIDSRWADTLYRFYGQTYTTEGNSARSDLMAETQVPALIGATVDSSDGKTAGRVEDLVIDAKDGRVALIVLDQVPGRGDAMVAVPFGELSMSGNAFALSITGDRLASAPDFWGTDLDNQRKAQDIYLFFGVQPYWTTGGTSMEDEGPAGAATMEP